MSCIVTANINGNTIEIPIIESSADGDISSQSIQKLTELVKYIKSDEEIIHSLYTSEQNLELRKTDSDFISNNIFSKTNTSIDVEPSIDVKITKIAEKIKESFKSLTKGIDIYKSNIDNDVQSLKIYNKKILIINPDLIEHNGLKLLDALINLNVDNESVSNKIEKAKELFDKGIVESYTQYLYEQEVSQNIYLQDFASINVVKYKQSIEHKNVFYNQELTSGSNPVPGDIIHKVIKQGDVETYEDYLYLGLSGEASNYHVLLKIVGNKIDSSQIYIEKILDKVLIYKPRLPYNYNFPTEHDIYTLTLDQEAIPKNVKHSINKGDMIKSSNKRNAPTYVVIDIILNDDNNEEYLVYNPEEQFKYIKNSNEIKIVSQNSKLVFKTQEFIESNYQTIINLENTDIAYNYFKLLKPDDVIEASDEETQYKIIQVNTDNTLQVISLDDDAERKKVKLEDVKKIYFKNYVKIDRDLNMLNVPLEFFKRSEYVSPFLNKFASLHNYGINIRGSNVSFYEPMKNNVEKQVYDLGNYKKLDIPQDQILNELMLDDIIYKEDRNISTKKFYKVVSKVVTKENDVDVIHVNVAMINDNGKYEIFELSQEFFDETSGELTIYSKDFKRSSSFRKATQDKFISDTGLDRKIIQMLEDKFNIPVEIIDDINQAYAYTDGEKIFINIAKRADDDNTYVLKHAVHEFVHLMLGNMRLNNPEDYRILIEVYKKHSIEFNKEHSNLNLNSGLQETEEELVTNLVDELSKLENVGTELNFEEELLNKISKGFGDLFNISDIGKMKKTEWLSENVGSVIKKYKNDFAIMTSENFQLSQIKKHNQFLKEIDKIKKEC